MFTLTTLCRLRGIRVTTHTQTYKSFSLIRWKIGESNSTQLNSPHLTTKLFCSCIFAKLFFHIHKQHITNTLNSKVIAFQWKWWFQKLHKLLCLWQIWPRASNVLEAHSDVHTNVRKAMQRNACKCSCIKTAFLAFWLWSIFHFNFQFSPQSASVLI